MKKFDRESNTRVWEGASKIVINSILAAFSLFCIYVTFFATWLDAIRLSSFVAGIVFIGFLMYPARKGKQRVNFIPWYDIILLVAGTSSFLYFTWTKFLPNKKYLHLSHADIFMSVTVLLSRLYNSDSLCKLHDYSRNNYKQKSDNICF